MENNQQNINQSTAVPLSDIFFRTLNFWPWIILSVFICVGIGFFYLLRTPKIYTETASLLIKDDDKGKSASAGVNELGDLGLFTSNTNIQNEISTLKSPDLMEEVVKRLDLMMNYYLPGTFHKVVAYGHTLPVTVSMPDYPLSQEASFNMVIGTDNKVKITNFKIPKEIYGDDYKKEYTTVIGDTIFTAAGSFVVLPNPQYTALNADIITSEINNDTTSPSTGDENQTSIQNFALSTPVELEVIKTSLANTIESYGTRLLVELNDKQGTVINLSITDQNIQRGDELLATLIGVYNENWIRDKNQIAVSTSNFINDRLNVIENELGNVDSDISSYKSANLVPDVGAAASSYLAETQALGQEIVGINNQLQMTRYIRNYLTSDGVNDKALPANTGVDNLDLQNQIATYNQKLLERNALVSKSSEKNPLVQNMDQELSAMRGAIVSSVDNSIVNLQTQMKGLQGARGAATSRLASNPTQAKYLLSVERQQKVKENLYLFLLQKREDNELNQAFTAYNTRVIKRPSGSGKPTSPKSAAILLCAFCVGLIIPFGTIYVVETSNTKVRGRKDVENVAVPLLGEIPQVGSSARKIPFVGAVTGSLKNNKTNKFSSNKESSKSERDVVLVKSGSRDIINEAFRVLRTNLEFSRINKTGCNVVAMTSFNPGSGKSFITMNLGASIALKNKKVIVIDGDMRHGSSSAYVGRPKKGLSDFLVGNTDDVKSIIKEVPGTNGLEIIPVGMVPPNPTELLESPRFEKLVDSLRPDYDYIMIDCPPIEVVADAQIIDQVTDRTIFIIRAGLLERGMLPALDNLYEEKKYNHMAVILNGTRNEPGMFGNSHSYRYGYGYGYGYGYNYANSES